MDIGTEELSHLEVVGTLARLHLAPMKFKREFAEAVRYCRRWRRQSVQFNGWTVDRRLPQGHWRA
jgi:Mn-containing catalase